MKPIKEIHGNLCYPLSAGHRAYIKCGEKALFTSTVVALREQTGTGVEIETLNTVYRLTYDGTGGLPCAV